MSLAGLQGFDSFLLLSFSFHVNPSVSSSLLRQFPTFHLALFLLCRLLVAPSTAWLGKDLYRIVIYECKVDRAFPEARSLRCQYEDPAVFAWTVATFTALLLCRRAKSDQEGQ